MSELKENMSEQEKAIKRFLRIHSNKQKDGCAIHSILKEVVTYYDADRANIFELNAEGTEFSNTYKWRMDGKAE